MGVGEEPGKQGMQQSVSGYGALISRMQRTCARLDKTVCRFAFFSLLLLLAGKSAFAQTSVGNVTRITKPTGFSCLDVITNPTCGRVDNRESSFCLADYESER